MKFLLLLMCYLSYPVQAKDITANLLSMDESYSREQQEQWISDVLAHADEAVAPGSALPGSRHEQVVHALVRLSEFLRLNSEHIVARGINTVTSLPQLMATNANLLQVGRNMSAWYNIFSGLGDSNFKRHIQNLALMFPVSHAIETVFGPSLGPLLPEFLQSSVEVLPFIHIANDTFTSGAAQYVLRGVGGVIGFMVSIPGLDPICLFLAWSYLKHPNIRNYVLRPLLFLPRMIVFKGGGEMIRKFSAALFLNNVFEKTNMIEELVKRSSQHLSWRLKSEDFLELVVKSDDGVALFKVNLGQGHESEKIWLNSIEFDQNHIMRLDRKNLLKMLDIFQGRKFYFIRNALREFLLFTHANRLDELAVDRVYIKSLTNDLITYYDNAISFNSKTISGKRCHELLYVISTKIL